jgi:uncharacterized protein with HEPN domain
MNKDYLIFLNHIIESIEKIESYLIDISKREFLSLKEKQDAVIRNIEIVGEAAKNISKVFQDNHPTIPWKEMIRTRDKIVHGYFGVDLDITWDIVKNHLPNLKEQIQEIIQKEQQITKKEKKE